MAWYEIVVSILSGLVAAIPLVVELVKYVKMAVKEKNWGNLVSLIMQLMMEAESKFEIGEDKKEWVLGMVQSSATAINYSIDIDQVSQLIESLCMMSKKVNVTKEEVSE